MSEHEWRTQAACRNDDTETWFPETGERHLTRQAKAICAECPVSAECLNEALTDRIEYGIWGGKTVTERRILGRKPPILRPKCGTRKGYETHRREHETACRRCLNAAQGERAAGRAEAEQVNGGHGSVTGYQTHLNLGETPCKPCKKANDDAEAKKYQRSVERRTSR